MSCSLYFPILDCYRRKNRRYLKRVRNKRERRLARQRPERGATYKKYSSDYW